MNNTLEQSCVSVQQAAMIGCQRKRYCRLPGTNGCRDFQCSPLKRPSMRPYSHVVKFVRLILTAFVVEATAAGAFAAEDAGSPGDWLKPPALKPGDTIALVAPAGPIKVPALDEYA